MKPSSEQGVDRTETDLDGRRTTLPSRYLARGTRVGSSRSVDLSIDHVLGEGGMGIVYRARDRHRARDVAVKTLHANLIGDAGLRRRFCREAELMSGWRHPHVVEVYELVDDEDLVAIVMEYVPGPTLGRFLEACGPVQPQALPGLLGGVLAAMGRAHRRGIVHRDLKPSNILLSPTGAAKVADFGIAKQLGGTRHTAVGALLGSCLYMAPEQVEDVGAVDHRADIYSLGVILYRALCGQCPFEGETPFQLMFAHVSQTPRPPSVHRPGIPPALDTLILDCLAKRPEQRPATCRELGDRLRIACELPRGLS